MPTSRGKFKTQRSVIGADGLPIEKEFVQKHPKGGKLESVRSVIQRANTWAVEMRGKAPSPSMSLEAAIDLYLEYREGDYRAGEISLPTFRADKTYSKHLKTLLGSVKIGSLDAYAIDLALRELAPKKRTAKGARESGRMIYKWLIKRKWATENPFLDSKPIDYSPPQYEEPIEDPWSVIAKVEDQTAREIYSALLCSGLRPKGIRELLLSEIVIRGDQVWIQKASAKNEAGKRPVYVTEPGASILKSKLESPTSLFAFPNPKTGQPYGQTWLCDHWRKVRPNERGPYDLKHFEVSRLVEANWTAPQIAARVGVKSAKSIEHYIQFNLNKLAERIDSSEQSRNRTKKKAKKA